MAKVNIKFEKITTFRGILHVRELFPVRSAPLSTKCWVYVVPFSIITVVYFSTTIYTVNDNVKVYQIII